MYDDCAFDQQQQEEATFFWDVADAVNSIEKNDANVFLYHMISQLSADKKRQVFDFFKECMNDA